MVANLIHFLSFAAIAILSSSFIAIPASALSIESSDHIARHHAIARNALEFSEPLKKKRSTSRCRARSLSSSILPTSSTPPAPSSTPPASSSSPIPSPSPPSVSPMSSSSPGTGKVGIAWSLGNDPSLQHFTSSKVKYIYTWSIYKPENLYGLTFAAMLWGEPQIEAFQKMVVAGYASICLGFNEPNQPGQSNLSPQRAAQLWSEFIQPLKKQGYRLGTPAVSSALNSMLWMQDFIAACRPLGCTFDFVAVHWYGLDPHQFIKYVMEFHQEFGMDIWVTEFACNDFVDNNQPSQNEVDTFMRTVTTWMDNTDYVEAYFAFGVMHDMKGVASTNQLMNIAGYPTTLGRMYLGES